MAIAEFAGDMPDTCLGSRAKTGFKDIRYATSSLYM
jgi:hypothetical protein